MFKYLIVCFFPIVSAISSLTHATIVQFQTSMGAFEVNLYDQRAPATVENFLSYVADDSYNDVIIHRSVSDYVVQGGGFSIATEDFPGTAVAAKPAVRNEPVFSNVRGTIAMAKLGNSPNSATSQWYFNLGDNSADLDASNGGYTVFGQVIGDGMDIVDAIAALPRFNLSSQNRAYSELPLRDYTTQNFSDGVMPDGDNVVIINAIVVIDGAEDTAAELEPALNQVQQSGGDDGGGSTDLLFLGLLLLALTKSVVTARARTS